MPQITKVTRRLDLNKTALIKGFKVTSKAANYTLDYRQDTESGSLVVADNSAQAIYFTLPAIATANGKAYNFFNANSGVMQIVAATNVIVNRLGVTQNAVNYGITAMKRGAAAKFYSNGVKWLHIDQTPVNVVVTNGIGDVLQSYLQG